MVLIGAFNIVSTLVMVVMEKRKDIAILQFDGRDPREHSKDFLCSKGASSVWSARFSACCSDWSFVA